MDVVDMELVLMVYAHAIQALLEMIAHTVW